MQEQERNDKYLVEQYAEELGVTMAELWADLCKNNSFETIGMCETLDDLRFLKTKYAKGAMAELINTFGSSPEMIYTAKRIRGQMASKSSKKPNFPRYCECGARLKMYDGKVKCRRCEKEWV